MDPMNLARRGPSGAATGTLRRLSVRVLIHPRTITATDKELRGRVTAVLETALAPVWSSLNWVDVYLTDVNGPKGGPDKQCRVVAHLPTGPVVVGRTGCDPVAAVAAAAVRCRRLVRSRLTRRRHRRRRAVGA
jgi:putative sigma-54 modulation protein